MRKTFIWSMVSFLLMTMLSVGFTSCSSDDDEDSSALVGKWKRFYEKTQEYRLEDGSWQLIREYEETGNEEVSYGFQFNSDGSAYLLEWTSSGEDMKETDEVFKYKVKNGHLYLLEVEDGEEYWDDWGSLSVKGKTMELNQDDTDEDYREVSVRRYLKI